MKILIFDNNEPNLIELSQLIQTISIDISIETTMDSNKILNIYRSDNFDLVFINCNNNLGIQVKNKIRNLNPDQKIIIVNNSFICSEPKGCEYCKTYTNTLRIFEPYRITDIINSFKNIQCDINYCNGDIKTKILIISKKYKDIAYNETDHTFSVLNGKADILSHISVVDLAQTLKYNKIGFSIENNLLKINI